MILYPTETIYGLGANVLDDCELAKIFTLKGRDERQTASWLVRDITDIYKYAEISSLAEKIITTFLPGQLTVVLPAKDTVPTYCQAADKTIGFRISSDPIAQRTIADFMNTHNAPLTCTSANVSGEAPAATPKEILTQFTTHNRDVSLITQIVDDGPRVGAASTIVRICHDQIEVLRIGPISERAIMDVIAHA